MDSRTSSSIQNSYISKNYSLPQLIPTHDLIQKAHFLTCKMNQVNTAEMNRSRSTASISKSSQATNDLRMNIYKKFKTLSISKISLNDFGNKMNIISKLHKKSDKQHIHQMNLDSKRSKIVASKSSHMGINRSERSLPKSLHSFKAVLDTSTNITPVKEKLPKIEENRSVGKNKPKVRLNRLVLSPDVIPADSHKRMFTLEDLRFIYNSRSPRPFRFDVY